MGNILCIIKMVIWDISLFDEAIQHGSSVIDIHFMLDVFRVFRLIYDYIYIRDWLLKKT